MRALELLMPPSPRPPQIISVDTSNKEERVLFEGAQKLVGLLITVIQAVAYVVSGMSHGSGRSRRSRQ